MENPITNQKYSFTWSGGFSYLTYLKKNHEITVTDQLMEITSQNFILGAFPAKKQKAELPLRNIKELGLQSKINWFDLVFGILFALITILTSQIWFLLVTILFLYLAFNTEGFLVDHLGNKTRIPSNSKKDMNRFLNNVAQLVNQSNSTTPIGDSSDSFVSNTQPIVPKTASKKTKTVFLVTSAIALAIIIIYVAILSRGGFENKYVQWVKEGTVPGTDLTMSQVLENKTYFSNVQWKEVQEEGNNLDNFVMYQATLSDQGVKVAVRTVFQVFGEDHFDAVESSADGESISISDWHVFLADMADRYNNTTIPKQASQPKESEPEKTSATPATTVPSEAASETPSNVTTPMAGEVNLLSFTKWSMLEPDLTVPLKLDGEDIDVLVGRDSPNGLKVVALSHTLDQGWRLQLDTEGDSEGPFDDFGNLREGFSLYIKDHDFANDKVPEVVVTVSDGLTETYVWVFTYNYLYSENGTSPLDLIWYGEGQSNVILDGNKIVLPFGSQGLFDEYIYSNNTFQKL